MYLPISSRRLAVIPAMVFLVAACSADPVTPPPPSPNAPTAVISASPTVVPRNDGNNTVVTLDGSGSTDPNGNSLTYRWTAASGTWAAPDTSVGEVANLKRVTMTVASTNPVLRGQRIFTVTSLKIPG